MVDVFRPVNARRLVTVRAVGQLGDGMLQTALATFVLFSPQREADPTKVAIAFAIMLLPYSFIGPFAGIFIDRWRRRDIFIWANIVRVVAMLGIGYTIHNHSTSSALIVLVLASLGVNRFLQASMAASIPHVVSDRELVTANALFPTLGTACSTIGAAIGITTQKVLANTDAVNAGIATAASALALSAALTATTIRPAGLLGPHGVTGKVREALRNVFTGLADGLRALNRARTARLCLLSVAAQRFAFGVLTVHVLLLARTVWNPSTNPDDAVTDFGLAAVSAAVGAAVAAVTSASLLAERDVQSGPRHRLLVSAALIAALIAIPLTGLGLERQHRGLVIATAGMLSFVGQLLKISTDTAIQQGVDDAYRGRAFALFDMAINASIVTGISLYALSPWLRLNSAATFGVIGCALLVAAAACGHVLRRARA